MATTHKVMQKEITYLPVHFPMITTARAESDWSQQSKTPTNKPLPTASQLSKYRKLDGKQQYVRYSHIGCRLSIPIHAHNLLRE